jgi:hypothetical protein
LKQIYYLEDGTNKIKVPAHAHFDEGLSSVPLANLCKALGHTVPPINDQPVSTPTDINLLSCPELFPVTFMHQFCIQGQDVVHECNTLGYILKEDVQLRRCFISNITPKSTAATYPRWHSTLIGAFILAVDHNIVFDFDDTTAALSQVLVDSTSSSSPTFVDITFAHDRALIRSQLDPDPGIASPIQLDQICHLSHAFETGEEIIYQP